MEIVFVSCGGPDGPLETFLRKVAVKYQKEGEWADKYGTTEDNDIFMMHPYCWCEKDDCPWCSGYAGPPILMGLKHHAERGTAPNFHHKASGFKVWWYKYIGRDMEQSEPLPAPLLSQMEAEILGRE